MKSPGIVGSCRISWLVSYLTFLQLLGEVLIYQIRGKAIFFTKETSPLPWRHVLCLSLCIVKIPKPDGSHRPPWPNFPGEFHQNFADCANVILPLQRTILQSITFELFIPNKTSKITRISANLEPVKQSKQFPVFDMIWVHNQNALWGFRVKYPRPGPSCFSELKHNLILL